MILQIMLQCSCLVDTVIITNSVEMVNDFIGIRYFGFGRNQYNNSIRFGQTITNVLQNKNQNMEERVMAQPDYAQLAKEVVKAVGGKENIVSVSNCMTRLRFVLKDDQIPDKDAVSAIKGVKGVMNQGGQYQVIIGTNVSDVISFVRKETGITDSQTVDKDAYKVVKEESLWNRFFKTIAGCIMPMIGPLVASGIIKGLLVILTTAGVLLSEDGTYQILYAAADSVMYFMPILVGFTCGKMFQCNPYVTAVIGAAFLYPDLVAAVESGISFLTIPVSGAAYSSTFLPVLLAAFLASKLEKLAKKIIPQVLQLIFVPTFVLAITVPLGWLVLGPVMNIVSEVLSKIVMGIFGASPLIGGAVIGACWQLVVLLGLHTAFIPVLINNLFTLGYDPVNAIMCLTVWAFAGVAFGYALRVKDKEKKSMGFGTMASALCGVTEPAIYSIALTNVKLFISGMIGGGVAGAIFGALGGKSYVWAGGGLFCIPSMINPEGLDISFYGFIICAIIALAVSAVLAFIFAGSANTAKETEMAAGSDVQQKKALMVYAPAEGNVISRDKIPDETFSSGVLGDGVGIEPCAEIVTAPFDGVVSSVTETKHAIGITSVQGLELLIHVGVDTVKMNGQGFEVFVKEGDSVKQGQKILQFDAKQIKKAGFSDTIAVILTNSADYQQVDCGTGSCSSRDVIMTVK